jgi:exopolysaccharide production protein ExoZ
MMILSVQYLRAIAALMVVYFHATSQLRELFGVGFGVSPQIGAAGVDIFFVISGFVMWISTANGTVSPLRFYSHRLTRIAPLYWTITAFVLMIVLIRPSLMTTASFDPPHVLASFAFVAWPHPVISERMWPIVVPGWTLNYEMLFYLIFGASLILPAKARLIITMLVLSGLVASRTIRPTNAWSNFYTNPILMEFAAGLVLGYIYQQGFKLRRSLAFGLFGLGIVLLLTFGGSFIEEGDAESARVLYWGIPASVIVTGLIFADRDRPLPSITLMKLLGDASYSLYLSQFLVLPAFALAWRLVGLEGDGLSRFSFMFGALVTASLAGIVFYLTIERPLLVGIRSFHRKRIVATAA